MQATIKALFAQHSERNKQASGSVLARPNYGLDSSVAPVSPTPRTTGQEVQTVVSSIEEAPPLAASAGEEGSAIPQALSSSAGVRAVNGVASLSRQKKRAKDFDYYLVRAPLSLRHFCIALPFDLPHYLKLTFSSLVNTPTIHPLPIKRALAQVMDFEATCCSRGHRLVSSAHPLWRSYQKFPSFDQEAKFLLLLSSQDPQELLEISCCALNANTRLIEAEFQAFVRPTEHPNLTDFCIELTGITQQQCVLISSR